MVRMRSFLSASSSSIVVCFALACSAEARPPTSTAPGAPSAPATPSPAASSSAPASDTAAASTIDLVVPDLDGKPFDFKTLRGKAVLVVNVASECGFTPQYAELQKLYATYQERGLVVVGFPSNDFGGQEPGTPAEIRKFTSSEYGVTFPLMSKVHARGDEMAPIYQTLTTLPDERLRGSIKWNFTKFLLDPQGRVIARFSPDTTPLSSEVVAAVEGVLPKKG